MEKLKINKIRNRIFVDVIKPERSDTIMQDIYVLNFDWLKQFLSLVSGFCISRPSVPTSVNRHTNLYFQLKGHVHHLFVCVGTKRFANLGVTYLTTVLK